jgi:hypothetical protein
MKLQVAHISTSARAQMRLEVRPTAGRLRLVYRGIEISFLRGV